MILSFYVWRTRTRPQTHSTARVPLTHRGSPRPGEPNLASARQSHAALHSILHVPWSCHRKSWALAHRTARPSPDCKASLSFRHFSSAGTRCVTGNILMKGRHLPRCCTLFGSSFLRRNPPRSLSTWRSGAYTGCNYRSAYAAGWALPSHPVLQERRTALATRRRRRGS